MLLKPRKKMPLIPKVNVACAFCFERMPQPKMVQAEEFGDVPGGHCSCGAFFVLDEVGRFGGQALLNVTTLACGGDVAKALKLKEGVDYEIRTMPLRARSPRRGAPKRLKLAERAAYDETRGKRGFNPVPSVWFLKLTEA